MKTVDCVKNFCINYLINNESGRKSLDNDVRLISLVIVNLSKVPHTNSEYLSKVRRDILDKRYKDEKRRQPGVAFPSAIKQEQ